MPRLNKFQITIHTGEHDLAEPVRCKFNTHQFVLNNVEGNTQSGGVLTGDFEPRSFVHGFTLVGPEEGKWSVDRVDLKFETDDGDWDLSFGPAELDDTNELNLWAARPEEAWDV